MACARLRIAGSTKPRKARMRWSRPAPLEVLDQLERQPPRSGQDRDRSVGHQTAPTGSRGVQIARSLPSRMKSRISCTIGWVANSASTSSTRSFKRALVGEQQAIGAAQVVDLLAREAAPAQPDDVEAREMGAVADRHAVRDDVVLDARHAADEGVLADAHELVHGRRRRRGWRSRRSAMAGEHHVVGADDVVADLAVVRDVRVDEEQAVVADDGRHRRRPRCRDSSSRPRGSCSSRRSRASTARRRYFRSCGGMADDAKG